MRKCFIFLIIIILFSCSEYKGDKNSIAYDRVEITFVGYGDYKTNGKLKILITNPLEVEKLNHLKNRSQRKWFVASLKSTEFHIRLRYVNSNTEEQLLISISKSTDHSPMIEYGLGTIFEGKYKNDELVNYIASLIKLELIKNHEGCLSQKEYDALD